MLVDYLLTIASKFPMMNTLSNAQIIAVFSPCDVKYKTAEGITINKKAARWASYSCLRIQFIIVFIHEAHEEH